MPESSSYDGLIAALIQSGFRVWGPQTNDDLTGFPLVLRPSSAPAIVLDFANPPFLGTLDPDVMGIAFLDPLGFTRKSWGIARRLRWFRHGECCLLSELGPIIQNALEGVPDSLYYDGYRFYAAAAESEGPIGVLLLVTYAGEEKLARRQAYMYSREADALKKIGRALNMNQSTVPLSYAAVHEIASVAELAAVLLWTIDPESGSLHLLASTGANRSGTAALAKLSATGGTSCVAELVAANRQPFFLPCVKNHVLTAELEGRFCYLPAGGVSVWPLVTGGNLIGVLEIIGRDGDDRFEEHLELFQTVAEHLALAVHSAQLFENFERLASHDPLTGLANHRAMQEFINLRIAESARTNAEIGVIMVDVDHFRSFNEEEGHETGDQVLKLVADTIKSIVRPYDLAARYGGEEFTVILPGSGRDSTQTIAERIRNSVESSAFETRSGRERHVTVSVGFAVYPTTAQDAGSILRAADAALYEAKRSGRNRVTFFESQFVDSGVSEMMSLEPLWNWIPPSERREVRRELEKASPILDSLCNAMKLSKNQAQILRGLFIVEDSYRRCSQTGDEKQLAKLKESQEFRVLEPSLLALDERFDGTGPNHMKGNRIPLMSRALTVLHALKLDGGRSLLDDPGRFDPEIVEIVARIEDAA